MPRKNTTETLALIEALLPDLSSSLTFEGLLDGRILHIKYQRYAKCEDMVPVTGLPVIANITSILDFEVCPECQAHPPWPHEFGRWLSSRAHSPTETSTLLGALAAQIHEFRNGHGQNATFERVLALEHLRAVYLDAGAPYTGSPLRSEAAALADSLIETFSDVAAQVEAERSVEMMAPQFALGSLQGSRSRLLAGIDRNELMSRFGSGVEKEFLERVLYTAERSHSTETLEGDVMRTLGSVFGELSDPATQGPELIDFTRGVLAAWRASIDALAADTGVEYLAVASDSVQSWTGKHAIALYADPSRRHCALRVPSVVGVWARTSSEIPAVAELMPGDDEQVIDTALRLFDPSDRSSPYYALSAALAAARAL